MLAALEDVCAELVVTQNSSARAMPADELGALAVDIFGADRVSVHPVLAEALESAIELAEAGPDDALGGSGVLVTGSVITAGEARTLLSGRRSVTAPDPVRAARALGGAAAGILVLEGIADAVRAARDRAERRRG